MMRGARLYDLMSDTKMPSFDPANPRNLNTPAVSDGLQVVKYPTDKGGYHIASPEELASLLVPRQVVDRGKIRGFQRELNAKRARQIAAAIREGAIMPTVEIALHRNAAWVTDGQHRVAGAIMARAELPTLARFMDEDQMRKLFAQQAKAQVVNPSILVLSADDPFSEWIQDAVTDDSHPWAPLVDPGLSSKTKLNPSQARGALIPYVTNTLAPPNHVDLEAAKFSEQRARDLGELLMAFGGKEANPLPYRSVFLRALTKAAVRIIIRHEHEERAAIKRWVKHMPKFNFQANSGTRSAHDALPVLIAHWNKRLDASRRVALVTDETT